jgi:hypothetical protein
MRIESPAAIGLLTAVLGVAAGAVTAGPWATKAFADWTEKDARAVMTRSPWAKEMPMPVNNRPDVMTVQPGYNVSSPPAASLGNPANTTTGGNMGVEGAGNPGPAEQGGARQSTARTPSAVQPSPGAPNPQPTITVIWASATPVRLAVLKLRSKGEAPPPAQVDRAKQPRDHYVIAVVGLPAPPPGADPKTLAGGAFLSVKSKPAVEASESDYRRIGQADVYFFRFTRASLPISASDRQVEFKLKFGPMNIKTRFDVNEMKYQGQLAL